MPAHLSPICSSLFVCISTLKFLVVAWRIRYEWTHSKPIVKPESIREPRLWLDTVMSGILFVLSALLLGNAFFGIEEKEKSSQMLLSLTGGTLVVHQSGYLSLYFGVWLGWLWLGPITCFLVTLSTSIPISPSVGHTQALKITLLSFVLAEQFTFFIAYTVLCFRGTLKRYLGSLIWWNLGLCLLAWAGALTSLILYVTGKVDFVTSLWIDNVVAIVWVVWVLWKQWVALQTARSQKDMSEFDIIHGGLGDVASQAESLRQNSMSQLVVPSAVHLV